MFKHTHTHTHTQLCKHLSYLIYTVSKQWVRLGNVWCSTLLQQRWNNKSCQIKFLQALHRVFRTETWDSSNLFLLAFCRHTSLRQRPKRLEELHEEARRGTRRMRICTHSKWSAPVQTSVHYISLSAFSNRFLCSLSACWTVANQLPASSNFSLSAIFVASAYKTSASWPSPTWQIYHA